ncbi:MAG: hypothetical protein IJ621_06145 [Paludibacteraceae bacterium]|nr:hypothetical protein [Paludibacteraceae bacterium]
MKRLNVFSVVLLMTATMLTACGAKKQVTQTSNSRKPFGPTSEMPCQIYDTPKEFAATTAWRGSKNKMEEVRFNALREAQNIIKMKVQHSYKGLVSEYKGSWGTNAGNDVADKMEMACDNVLQGILSQTSESCIRWSDIDDDGHLYCYIAITISKEELAAKSAKAVKNLLTEDEKRRIDFKEEEFRKKMEERYENFKNED